MKYSVVGGQRREAEPALSGECPVCGAAMVAKCGEHRVWHWAHRSRRRCDHWWEPESDWHRNWKNHFPVEWQEVIQTAEDGEKHIADVKTDQGRVIEFQHSYIKPEERRSREAFYGNMAWVVDGLRRKNDLKQFNQTVRDHGQPISQEPLIVSIFPLFSRLVMEWSSSRAPVYIDFGEGLQRHDLWLLIPTGSDSKMYIALIEKEDFVGWHRKGDLNFQPLINKIKSYEQWRRRENEAYYALQRIPYKTGKHRPQSFQQYMARKQRSRRRL